jgi:hypothetical protein
MCYCQVACLPNSLVMMAAVSDAVLNLPWWLLVWLDNEIDRLLSRYTEKASLSLFEVPHWDHPSLFWIS